MANLTILCAVAAEFTNPETGEKFRVKPHDRNAILSAPAWIEKTDLFGWLVQDGTIKAVTSVNRVQAENEPGLGLNAEGKAVKPAAKVTKSKAVPAAAKAAKEEGKDAE